MSSPLGNNFLKTKPDFISKKIDLPYYLNRFDKENSRYYFEIDGIGKNKKVIPYISITSLADKVLPGGTELNRWREAMGKESNRYMMERAEFGTLFHMEAMKPFIGGKIHGKGYNWDWLDKRGRGQRLTNFERMISPDWRWAAPKWKYSFKRGLMAWFEFVRTEVLEVLAVEITLRSKNGGFATTIDFAHTMKFSQKERRAITDIKSFLYGPQDSKRKGFWESNEFQLEGCKMAWNENFPDLQVTHVFNWAPNAWKKEPTWQHKNQTKNSFSKVSVVDNTPMTSFEILLAYAKSRGFSRPPTNVVEIAGKINDIKNFHWKDYIIELKTIEE